MSLILLFNGPLATSGPPPPPPTVVYAGGITDILGLVGGATATPETAIGILQALVGARIGITDDGGSGGTGSASGGSSGIQ